MASRAEYREFPADRLRDAASMVALNVDVLSAGATPSRIRQVRSTHGWACDTAELNSHVWARGGFVERPSVTVLTVLRPADATICGVPLHERVVMAIPAGEEIVASIRPGLAYAATVVPVAMWSDIVATASGLADTRPARPAGVRLSAGQAMAVHARLAAALSDLGCGADVRAEMPATLTDYLGAVATAWIGEATLQRGLDHSLRRRMEQARRGADLIHAHLRDDLSIAWLCREIRASRRQVEYAFRTTFDVGPAEYIRLARLNESRRLLMSARARGRTVTDIAMDVGVTHLGRFAESYRRLFGETPRQTSRGGGS